MNLDGIVDSVSAPVARNHITASATISCKQTLLLCWENTASTINNLCQSNGPPAPWKGLSHQLECPCSTACEHHLILCRISVEVLQHQVTNLFNLLACHAAAGVGTVRVAKHVAAQLLKHTLYLRLAVYAAACVVQVVLVGLHAAPNLTGQEQRHTRATQCNCHAPD